MKKETFKRKELYDLVWSYPMLTLSKKYNISYYDLRKMCKRMNIPIPQIGHWQKVQYGKKVEVIKLPSNNNGENEISLSPKVISGNQTFQSPLKILIKEIKADKNLPLKVPSKLSNPDKLVIEAKESLSSKGTHYGRYEGVVSTNYGQLNIRVAPKNIGRALRFLNAFIKLLRARNHEIIVESDTTHVIINGEKIEISLKEKFRIVQKNDRWGGIEYVPTGKLALVKEGIHKKDYKDGRLLIEDQLAVILAKLEIIAKQEKEERLRREEEWRKIDERIRIEDEVKERKTQEIEKFKELLNQAFQWHQARILRNYLEEMEKNINLKSSLNDKNRDWLSWAKHKIDWYDPTVNKDDAILNKKDKQAIYESLSDNHKSLY